MRKKCVVHRIDDLEIVCSVTVSLYGVVHRIDDLEKYLYILIYQVYVVHRIDDLESSRIARLQLV